MLSNLVDTFCLKLIYKLMKISYAYFQVLRIHTVYHLTKQQTNKQNKTKSLLIMQSTDLSLETRRFQ